MGGADGGQQGGDLVFGLLDDDSVVVLVGREELKHGGGGGHGVTGDKTTAAADGAHSDGHVAVDEDTIFASGAGLDLKVEPVLELGAVFDGGGEDFDVGGGEFLAALSGITTGEGFAEGAFNVLGGEIRDANEDTDGGGVGHELVAADVGGEFDERCPDYEKIAAFEKRVVEFVIFIKDDGTAGEDVVDALADGLLVERQ